MKIYFLLTLVFAGFISNAQVSRYTIKLTDKRNSPYSISRPSEYLSVKAIQRRLKQNISIDSTDLPVNPFYIDSIAKISGITIINISKWLNQVLVEVSDPSALNKINAYTFVSKSDMVSLNAAKIKGIDNTISRSRPVPKKSVIKNSILETTGTISDTIHYGNNYPQVHIHEGEFLHKLGYRGDDITIAVLDGGFYKYKTNPAFDSIRMNGRVLGEYDFVMNETSVDEDNVHGSNCLSIMAANRPGFIVGTAPNANYWLFRTEDVATERPVEEQNWVAAAEKADSLGVDMISSSLGYTNFDDPAYDHSYLQRNGNTAMITIGADLAAKKGMIVMVAAGNSGNANSDVKYVMCPADGDSVTTVGAINASGVIGNFSCWGPNGAGKTKPNIVSVGWHAVYANPLGDPATGNGTSYATPNIAGLIACFWQAFPDFTNMEIIDAVERSADRFQNPDNRYGNGIPNFRIAYNLLMAKREERLQSKLKRSFISAYPVPFKNDLTVFMKAPFSGNASLRLIDISGRIMQTKTMQVQQNNYYTIDMNPPALTAGVYYLHYFDGKNKSIIKLVSF